MVRVERVEGDRWLAEFSANAHLAVFNEHMPPGLDRIDFALLAVQKLGGEDKATAYLTARELDSESVYMKHGGVFESIKGTVYSIQTYRAFIKYLIERYERITTLVENTNVAYLKFALALGFLIIGVRTFKGSIFLELHLEKERAQWGH